MKNLTINKILGMLVMATMLSACGDDGEYDYAYFMDGACSGSSGYQPQGQASTTVYRGNFGAGGDIQMLTYPVGISGEFEAVAVVNFSNAMDAYFPGMGSTVNNSGGYLGGYTGSSCPKRRVQICLSTQGQVGHLDYDGKLDISLVNGTYSANMGATTAGVQARIDGTRIEGAVEVTIPSCGTDTFIAN